MIFRTHFQKKNICDPKNQITQLMRSISIDSKDTAAVKKLNPTAEGLSCLEAISFDYVVKERLLFSILHGNCLPAGCLG